MTLIREMLNPFYRWLIYPFLISLSGGCMALNAAFVDATMEAGLDYRQMPLGFESEVTVHLQSGGAAAGDFDGDGWVDLFVTRVGDTDLLFRNLGGESTDGIVRFEDVSESAGFTQVLNSNGAGWGDIDNDGDLDLYVTTLYSERFYLYFNNGDGTFSEQATFRGAALKSSTAHLGFSVAFGDYDRDGYLDIHTCEWDIPFGSPDFSQHAVLLRNLGRPAPGFFSNNTNIAGVTLKGVERGSGSGIKILYGFTSQFSDLDGDGWPDLLVAADYGSSQLFWNNGNGTFTEADSSAGIGMAGNAMGSAVGDFNGDGLLDWFVSSIEDNRLYQNLGDRRFSEVARDIGPPDAENFGLMDYAWGWGSAFFDFDNDGDEDLVSANGHENRDPDVFYGIIEYVDQTLLWRNEEGLFRKVSDEMGMTDMEPGKGLLWFDYDRDGDLDVFIANCQARPILYRNDSANTNGWLQVELSGRRSNAQGIGARLELVCAQGDPPQVKELSGGSHYLSQSEDIVHFGTGTHDQMYHSLTIHWPSGGTQVLRNVDARQRILVREPVSYEDWQTRLTPRYADPLGSPEDDFDHDGASNRMEYIFSSNPRDPKDQPRPGTLKPSLHKEGNTVTARYTRPSGFTEGAFIYEVSHNLIDWTPIGDSVSTPENLITADGVSETVEFVFQSPAHPVWFLRIRAAF